MRKRQKYEKCKGAGRIDPPQMPSGHSRRKVLTEWKDESCPELRTNLINHIKKVSWSSRIIKNKSITKHITVKLPHANVKGKRVYYREAEGIWAADFSTTVLQPGDDGRCLKDKWRESNCQCQTPS